MERQQRGMGSQTGPEHEAVGVRRDGESGLLLLLQLPLGWGQCCSCDTLILSTPDLTGSNSLPPCCCCLLVARPVPGRAAAVSCTSSELRLVHRHAAHTLRASRTQLTDQPQLSLTLTAHSIDSTSFHSPPPSFFNPASELIWPLCFYSHQLTGTCHVHLS